MSKNSESALEITHGGAAKCPYSQVILKYDSFPPNHLIILHLNMKEVMSCVLVGIWRPSWIFIIMFNDWFHKIPYDLTPKSSS